MKILLTGGAGYIGSHTAVQLLAQGHDVVIVDNLGNSKESAVGRIEALAGKKVAFYAYDLLDYEKLCTVFDRENVDAVIHFAGLKAVGESVEKPLAYYENNVGGTISLLKAMKGAGVKNIVFSSSATVYGTPETVPIREDAKLSALNPYGATKLFIERILQDCAVDPAFSAILLRYFNPVGAHESGCIGEDPNGIPNNLVPFLSKLAIGELKTLKLFGNDYPTPDGTCIRDYIHVMDLADGHVAALKLFAQGPCGVKTYNLGSGKGSSVLEVIAAFSKAVGRDLPYEIAERRPGDAAETYADASKAEKELGWKAQRTLDQMCADAWNWQQKNPHGYE